MLIWNRLLLSVLWRIYGIEYCIQNARKEENDQQKGKPKNLRFKEYEK